MQSYIHQNHWNPQEKNNLVGTEEQSSYYPSLMEIRQSD